MFASAKLKKLDIYRKLPKDLTQPTLAGAILSLASFLLLTILFVSELEQYIDPNTHSFMYLDTKSTTDQIVVNLHIKFQKVPCDFLSI